jgi:hypothetical protein
MKTKASIRIVLPMIATVLFGAVPETWATFEDSVPFALDTRNFEASLSYLVNTTGARRDRQYRDHRPGWQ